MAQKAKKKVQTKKKKKTSAKKAKAKKTATKKKKTSRRKKKASSTASEIRTVAAELIDDDLPTEPSGDDSSHTSEKSPSQSKALALLGNDSKSLATTDPVSAYLAGIRKYPLLSREDERNIAEKYYDSKDPALAEVLVTSNLRFVVKIAAEYARFGSKMIDLIQEGNVGLMHAVKEFNPYKGVRLISYAVWWIRGYIQEFLMRQYSMVRIGTTQNQRKLFYQLQKERKALELAGESAGIEELSEKLDVPESDVRMMTQRMSSRDVSLNQPLDNDSQSSLMDFQSSNQDESIEDQLSQMELLEKLLHQIDEIRPKLNEREVFLLENRILADSPMTLQEIGDKYDVTREAVRQMEARLMKKIKESFLEEVINHPGAIDEEPT